VNLLEHLQTLSPAQLQTLLVRRPGAATLTSEIEGGMAELAELLASPDDIDEATNRLSRFELRVLGLACVSGGTLSQDAALEQGLSRAAIERAAGSLASFGLAFPERGGVHVPDEVAAEVTVTGGLGVPMRMLLAEDPVAGLRIIAGAVGVPPARGKDRLIEQLVERLSGRDTIVELLQRGGPGPQRTLEVIRERGGTMAFDELAKAAPSEGLDGLDRRPERPQNAVQWLWSTGLVCVQVWQRLVMVPAEIELALRGRAYAMWEVDPPPLRPVPVMSTREPLHVVGEMAAALQHWAGADVPLLKSGAFGVRERRRTAAELKLSETSVQRLLSLGVWAGLLTVRSEEETARPRRRRSGSDMRSFLTVTDQGRRWLSARPADAWLALFRGWLRVVFERPMGDQPVTPLGTVVLDALASLPRGRGAGLESLQHRLAWEHPLTWGAEENVASGVAAVANGLHLLGIGPPPPSAGLTDLGRAALAGADAGAIEELLPAVLERCRVEADLSVVVPGFPGPGLAADLSRVADLQSASGTHVYRLSEASVRRALDQAMNGDEIERLLGERSGAPVPGTVLELIRAVASRHGRLRVGAAAVYVASDDPALLAEVAASPRLGSLNVRQVSDTAAVVEGKTVEQVLTALRRAGFMPGIEEPVTDVAVEQPRSIGNLALPMPEPPSEEYRSLSPSEATALAEWLMATPSLEAGRAGRRPAPRLEREPEEDDQPELVYLFKRRP
jgi:Helicase conserved C-terminal domain